VKKVLSHILPLIVAILCLVPPIKFLVHPPEFEYWPMMILIAGLLGIRILFINTNIFIKTTSILTFIICFFSSSPYTSFNQYISIIACCYFYIGLTRMNSWKPMFSILKSILILNSILIAIQIIGYDQLLNFGLTEITTYGIIGHYMQMGSFSVILGTCLSIINPLFFLFPVIIGLITKSTWTLFCASIGLWLRFKSEWFRVIAIIVFFTAIIVCIKTGKIQQGLSPEVGRLIVWKKSIILLNERPLYGWGSGMFKYIFPALSKMKTIPWTNAHNDWIQLAFELGYILFSLILLGWFWILIRSIKRKQTIFLTGFIVISINMLVHFPLRMIQCVPLIILFLAYQERRGINPA